MASFTSLEAFISVPNCTKNDFSDIFESLSTAESKFFPSFTFSKLVFCLFECYFADFNLNFVFQENWRMAKKLCVRMGLKLASIMSIEENQILENALSKRPKF